MDEVSFACEKGPPRFKDDVPNSFYTRHAREKTVRAVNRLVMELEIGGPHFHDFPVREQSWLPFLWSFLQTDDPSMEEEMLKKKKRLLEQKMKQWGEDRKCL